MAVGRKTLRLAIALLCGLAALQLAACAAKKADLPKETPVIIGIAGATPTEAPSPVPTPAPDMVFEDDGDIYFSDAYKARFAAKTFAFDHAPRVLIYHTHAREAFREDESNAAAAGGTGAFDVSPSPTAAPTYRSDNPAETVVRLGSLLREALEARGFTVLHDAADVEAPSLSTAYARSLAVMQKYRDIDIYIDLHRNAANVDRAKNDVVMIDGARIARMFFVVGTGLTVDGDGSELSNWRENYVFALSLTKRLAAVDAALVKDVRVKQKAYNQQMGLCLLAEIGHNANLLAEAERTIPYFADALAAVVNFP